MEYEYTSKMKMKDLSCVGFKFSLTGLGDLVSNFTFRFPPKTGFFYHVPTFSTVSDLDNAVWETNFKRGTIELRNYATFTQPFFKNQRPIIFYEIVDPLHNHATYVNRKRYTFSHLLKLLRHHATLLTN